MTGMAIVAIPEADNYIWKISSEKKPHVTLLFLGDQSANPNLQHMIEYVEHSVKTLKRIMYAEVDRRGELGEDKADVLFMRKDEMKALKDFRNNLLKDRFILEAYQSVEQFPEWTPHVTLGYPESPAKEDDRDHPGIHWIEFDKIAVWTEDFDGPEFVIPLPESHMEMSDKTENFLAHYGVLGMKWGRRKARTTKPASGTPFRKGETRQVSDTDLRQRINRLTMEKQYREITAKPKSKGAEFVKDVILQSAKSAAVSQLTKALNAGVTTAFAKAAMGAPDGTTTKIFYSAMAAGGKKNK